VGRVTSYRVLCGVVGLLLLILGLGSVLGAFAAMGPDGTPPGPIPVGPGGVYFIAFAGTALVAWGGGLLGAVREPEASRSLATATAVALVIGAVFRAFAWLMGDYAYLGNLLRVEAMLLLLVALAFVWLRPERRKEA
jgi:hypothetical protein